MTEDFEDLLAANRAYAEHADLSGLEGRAAAGVGIVTCMDARIDPLAVLGLRLGDAKVFRNPGGRVTPAAVEAAVLMVNLLGVDRLVVMPHTRCAMASATQDELRERVSAACGADASHEEFGVVADQAAALLDDVRTLREHPLVPARVQVAGFVYDVETGLLDRRT